MVGTRRWRSSGPDSRLFSCETKGRTSMPRLGAGWNAGVWASMAFMCRAPRPKSALHAYPGSTGVGRVTLLAVPGDSRGPLDIIRQLKQANSQRPPPPTRLRYPLILARGLAIIIDSVIMAGPPWVMVMARERNESNDNMPRRPFMSTIAPPCLVFRISRFSLSISSDSS